MNMDVTNILVRSIHKANIMDWEDNAWLLVKFMRVCFLMALDMDMVERFNTITTILACGIKARNSTNPALTGAVAMMILFSLHASTKIFLEPKRK